MQVTTFYYLDIELSILMVERNPKNTPIKSPKENTIPKQIKRKINW
jgi:hypothetical protein